MQNQWSSGAKPSRRSSGSFDPLISAPLSPKKHSAPRRNSHSLPFSENPYARSSSTIYSGGEKAIFRNHGTSRRNIVVLCVMGTLCALMIFFLVAFALGKNVGLAEAGTAQADQASQTSTIAVDEEEAFPQ